MVMRITENMKFRTATASLGNVQDRYNNILEKMASQKRINRLSDDPLGMSMLLGYRQTQTYIEQYQKNIDKSNGWLKDTESKLSAAGEVIMRATELAIVQGSATATEETRRIAAESMEQMKGEMLSIANSRYGDKYLFSGSRTDTVPFSNVSSPASVGAAVAAINNQFNGTAVSSGTYNGSENKTYLLKVTGDGGLGTATYKISDDGGRTWITADTTFPLSGLVNITADGSIKLQFTENSIPFAAGDTFRVDAYAAGNYKGDGESLSIDIGKDSAVNYNITGEAAFAKQDGDGVNVFKVLDDLKSALSNNDAQGVLAQLNYLKTAKDQIDFSTSMVGNTMNRIELAGGNLQDLTQQISELTSKTEDADVSELATSLSMKEIALQASYAVASKIGKNTILDFIK